MNSEFISPNGDGRLDELELEAKLSKAAQWSFVIESDGDAGEMFGLLSVGSPVFSMEGEGSEMSLTWDGTDTNGLLVADGTYTWRITASDTVGMSMEPVEGTIGVDRVAIVFSDIRALGNPFRHRHPAPFAIRTSLSEAGTVKVRIVKRRRLVRRLGPVATDAAGPVYLRWDGRNRNGKKVRPGRYRVVLRGLDLAGNLTVNRALRIRVKR